MAHKGFISGDTPSYAFVASFFAFVVSFYIMMVFKQKTKLLFFPLVWACREEG